MDAIRSAGELRDATLQEVRRVDDCTYVTQEINRLQAAAHRIVAFLDETEGEDRN